MKNNHVKKKVTKIHELLLEILERINLKFDGEPSFRNISSFLMEQNLISEQYSHKLSILDRIDQYCNEKSLLNQELNNIELYLLSRFYHYI